MDGAERNLDVHAMLEELQEQFALGGDVELLIDAAAVVLDRADGDAEPLGDVGGRVSGENQLHQLSLAQRKLGPEAFRYSGLLLWRGAGTGRRRGAGKVAAARLDVERMQGLEHRQPFGELRDLAVPERYGRAVEEDAEAPVAAIGKQDADLVADLRLRQEAGYVLAALGSASPLSGMMPSRRSRRHEA